MSGRRWGKNRKKPPAGFDVIEPVLEALENELRDKVKESNAGKRKTESLWPVHQINWQRSRYVYEMYYTYHKISKQVYDFCIKQKLIDAPLIAKWKKPGYERLCSTYVINPSNYKFGTTSICRVPYKDRNEDQMDAQDPTTGCKGCASGKGAGAKNIFGNKYGQSLAAVQVAREKRMEETQKRREEQARLEEERRQQQLAAAASQGQDDDDGESETDEDTDDEDYGPTPVAGVWAGSQKLQQESERLAGQGDDDDDDSDDDFAGPQPPPSKKVRTG